MATPCDSPWRRLMYAVLLALALQFALVIIVTPRTQQSITHMPRVSIEVELFSSIAQTEKESSVIASQTAVSPDKAVRENKAQKHQTPENKPNPSAVTETRNADIVKNVKPVPYLEKNKTAETGATASKNRSATLSAQPDYLKNPPPNYPVLARRRGWTGVVFLRVQVSESGSPEKILLHKTSGYKLLDKAALQAVKQWRFIPARQAGRSIDSWVELPVQFKLKS